MNENQNDNRVYISEDGLTDNFAELLIGAVQNDPRLLMVIEKIRDVQDVDSGKVGVASAQAEEIPGFVLAEMQDFISEAKEGGISQGTLDGFVIELRALEVKYPQIRGIIENAISRAEEELKEIEYRKFEVEDSKEGPNIRENNLRDGEIIRRVAGELDRGINSVQQSSDLEQNRSFEHNPGNKLNKKEGRSI